MGNSDSSGQADEQEGTVRRQVNKMVITVGIAVTLAIVAAVYLAFNFVEEERGRNIQAWQVRLGIVADSRTSAVNEWVDENFGVMRELSENASLQVYMTQLTLANGRKAEITDEDGQAGYLRNLLISTANRAGYIPPPTAGDVAANVEKAGVAGLALADASGNFIVSTPSMPPVSSKIRKAVLKALGGEPALIDVFMGSSNLPSVGFVLPIFSVQGDEPKGIGAVIGIRLLGKDLFNKLKQPGETAASAETYLVRELAGTVEYISPLADGTPPLKRSLAKDTPNLAATFALKTLGGFGQKMDYLGEDVLVTSRPIANFPWVLVRKISRMEALFETETRLKTILIVFILIIVGVAVGFIAVWRHGSSVRSTKALEAFRISSLRFENMTKFMRVVTNSQPTIIVAVDGTTTYTFANEPAGVDAGIPHGDILGKTMTSVIGPIKATKLAAINKQILANFEEAESVAPETSVADVRESHVLTFEMEDGEEQIIKSDHIPLRGDRDFPPGILMVLDDITELTRERRRSEQMLSELINTLVSVVDRRDPFSANHSHRIAEVARSTGQEMGLDDLELKTLDTAGRLINLGKIFIPTSLLTKTENLTPEEYDLLAKSVQVSGDLLKNVSFPGSVVETICQVGEKIDGTGPLKMSKGEILPTAQILAVARTFVGMVSSRAYREAMPFDDAVKLLLGLSGSEFESKPISALVNYLDNRDGREQWAHFREQPSDAAE